MEIIHCEDLSLTLAFILNIFFNLLEDHFTHYNKEITMPAPVDHSG